MGVEIWEGKTHVVVENIISFWNPIPLCSSSDFPEKKVSFVLVLPRMHQEQIYKFPRFLLRMYY